MSRGGGYFVALDCMFDLIGHVQLPISDVLEKPASIVASTNLHHVLKM